MSDVSREPLTRREIGVIAAWVKSGFALDDGSEERKPYAQRIVAKLRGLYANAPADAGPDDDTPSNYAVPPSQSATASQARAELWKAMDPAPTIGDDAWREYAGALAACDVALAMGARRAAIVNDDDDALVVRILAADEIGCNWTEVWRPPVRKQGSPSRWDGSSGGGSRRRRK